MDMNITQKPSRPAAGTRLASRSAVVLLALSLGGCMSLSGAAPQDPGIDLPQQWSVASSGVAGYDQAAYWQALGDPVLTQLVEAALDNNLDIAQSAARLVQARETLKQAGASWLPQVSASGGASRAVGDGASDDVSFSLGLDASWEVDLFGGIASAADAAKFDYASAGYSLVDVRRAIAGQVAQQVISARSTAQQLAIARETLTIQDENLQIARWRLQAGLVSSLDVEQARTQRAQTAASIPQLESQLTATSNAISTLVGEVPGRVAGLLAEPAPIPAPPALGELAPPADLLRRRPDIRMAETTLLADTARIGVRRANMFPALTLIGNLGTSDSGGLNLFDTITGTVSAAVKQLLFDGGRTASQIRQAEAVADGSLAAWQQSVLSGLEEVESGLVALRAADTRLADLADAQEAAENAAIIARSQYQAGLIDFETLLTSESSLLSARNSYVSGQADRATAFVTLTQALGGGWSPDEWADGPDNRNLP